MIVILPSPISSCAPCSFDLRVPTSARVSNTRIGSTLRPERSAHVRLPRRASTGALDSTGGATGWSRASGTAARCNDGGATVRGAGAGTARYRLQPLRPDLRWRRFLIATFRRLNAIGGWVSVGGNWLPRAGRCLVRRFGGVPSQHDVAMRTPTTARTAAAACAQTKCPRRVARHGRGDDRSHQPFDCRSLL